MDTETGTGNATPTVFVIDDDVYMRDALVRMLATAGVACRIFASAEAFLDSLPGLGDVAGCLLLDVRMPGMSGLDLQDKLTGMGVDLPIVFITGHGDIPTAVRAVRGGALDFLSLPVDREKLLAKVDEALGLDTRRRERRAELAELNVRLDTLSPRETQVFERVADGFSNKAVAIDLGISERTVEIHRARVMRKMKANNLAELVRMRIKLGHEG